MHAHSLLLDAFVKLYLAKRCSEPVYGVGVEHSVWRHYYHGTFAYDYEISFRCETGKNLTSGNLTRQCVLDSSGKPVWSGNQPVCSGKTI